MSAIGDYVHYYAKNYMKYGTNKVGEGANDAPSVYAKARRDIIKKARALNPPLQGGYSKTELTRILNMLFHIGGGDIKSNYSKAEIEWGNAYRKLMESQFGPALQKMTRTGDITQLIKNIETVKSQALSKIKNTNVTPHTLNSMKKRMEVIKANIASIVAGTSNTSWETKVSTELQKLEIEYNTLVQKLDSSMKQGITPLDLKKITNNLINKINDLDKRTALSTSVKYQKGEGMEYATALALGMATGLSLKEVEKAIKKGVIKIGSQTSPPKIDTSRLDSTIMAANSGNNSLLTTRNLGEYLEKMSITPTQNKVDVSVTLENGSELNASVKNYNLQNAYNIHLVNGSSLLYLMMEQSDNIVNHWLNILSAHQDGGSLFSSNYRSNGLLTLKMSIALSAMAGTSKDVKKANLFIVNNNAVQQGKNNILIYTTGELLLKCFDGNMSFININPGLESIRLFNQWDEQSAQGRIANIIAQARNIKLSASISKQALTK